MNGWNTIKLVYDLEVYPSQLLSLLTTLGRA